MVVSWVEEWLRLWRRGSGGQKSRERKSGGLYMIFGARTYLKSFVNVFV
jgi:hypothetical protein